MPNHCDDSYMYLNYYTAEVNDEIDNPPIGLILCTDKGNVANINSVEATISEYSAHSEPLRPQLRAT